MSFVPAYLRLGQDALEARAREARAHLARCDLCAQHCGVDRTEGTAGAVCRTGEQAVVASWGPHFGEERPLVGRRGSGTIFFAGCNLRCVFCQNADISQQLVGRTLDDAGLAEVMLELQEEGCHNVNLVSPSHVVAQIVGAVAVAASRGLRLPLVYNTGGYDSPEALALLDGLVDVYMPDMKYGDSAPARSYSKARSYAEVNRAAVKEMHRQVGDLVVDADGLARRGLLVRHLVLPEGLAGTERILDFLAEEVSRDTYLNLMDQYRPFYRTGAYPELDRPVTRSEFEAALEAARARGLHRLDHDRARFF